MATNQTINVDFTPGLFQPALYYVQGDVGRVFNLNLMGLDIPSGASVTLEATKPSGFGFVVEADSVVDGVATFTTTETMTAEWGRFPAGVHISSGSIEVGYASFLMVGQKKTHDEGTIDGDAETIIPELTLLVERVEAAAESVLGITVEAETLPAGSQATYSFDEETSTVTFGIPQGEAGAGSAGVVADAYSASQTYAVGDYVIHEGSLYRCTTAITTAESFTASHWTQVVLADDVSDLKSDLSDETSARILLAGRVTTAESNIDTLETHKVAQPLDEYNQPTDGTNGQSLRTKGDGTTEWADVGLPTDEQTAQAVSDWLDAHPEATTTVQDGSLTEAKFTDALKLKTIKDYVTPEMFGAKGDGETDDTDAIQAASDYSQENGCALVCEKTYLISDTVTFRESTYINGSFVYSGSGTAIILNCGGINCRTYKISVSCQNIATTTVGVKVVNSNNNTFEFAWVSQFYKAIEFWGDASGCAYNKVYLNYIYRFCYGLSLINNNDGWVNENTFYDGRFTRHNIYSENYAVFMDSVDGLHVNQNNTFITPCLENSKTAFYFRYGRNTNVIKARTEKVTTVLKAEEPSYGNIIDVAYGSYAIDSPKAINYIIHDRHERISSLLTHLVFDSGDLTNACASNASGASCPSLYLYNVNTGKSPIMGSLVAVEKGLSYVNGGYGIAGVLINKNDSKLFEVFVDHTGNSSIGILQLDSNGDVIDVYPNIYFITMSKTTQGASKLGVTDYYVTSSLDNSFIFSPDANCVKFFIFAKGNNADRVVHRMRIMSDGHANYEKLQDHATLNAIPTSAGYDGQFVKAQTPTSSCIGWMYYNSQWNVVTP